MPITTGVCFSLLFASCNSTREYEISGTPQKRQKVVYGSYVINRLVSLYWILIFQGFSGFPVHEKHCSKGRSFFFECWKSSSRYTCFNSLFENIDSKTINNHKLPDHLQENATTPFYLVVFSQAPHLLFSSFITLIPVCFFRAYKMQYYCSF